MFYHIFHLFNKSKQLKLVKIPSLQISSNCSIISSYRFLSLRRSIKLMMPDRVCLLNLPFIRVTDRAVAHLFPLGFCFIGINAGVAELADALDLGSSGFPCRFKSCRPHQKSTSFDRSLSIFTSSLLTLHFSLFSNETCRLSNR